MSATKAGNEEAFLSLDDKALIPGNPSAEILFLSFFPTSEGFYDYENLRYIYQYKDHLGNVRLSFVKNSAGDLEIRDTNDYYPFGMSFLKNTTNSYYDPMAIPYNYKYNGKELQETGMYDYGARFYMPDIGRWGVVDPLAEMYQPMSTYNYGGNNPIYFIDPNGMNLDWYENESNGNISWHEGSAEIHGHKNLGASTSVGTSSSNGDGTWNDANYDLNSDGTITRQDGTTITGGASETSNGYTLTSGRYSGVQGSINEFVDGLMGNTPGNFSIAVGGANTNVGNSTYIPGLDHVVWAGNFFGGILNGGLGGKLDVKMSQSEAILGALEKMSGLSFGSNKDDSIIIQRPYYKADLTMGDTIQTVQKKDFPRINRGIDSLSEANAVNWMNSNKFMGYDKYKTSY